MIFHDTGTVCVSQTVPNGNEFANFVHEVQNRGYLASAAACSPTNSPVGAYFYGEEPNVMVLSAKTKSAYEGVLVPHGMILTESTMKIVATQPDPVPEDIFQIPSDWKVKKDSRPL